MNTTLHCKQCNFTGSTTSHFIKHLQTEKHKRSGIKKSELNICDKCGHKSQNSYHLKMHIITQHGPSDEKKEFCKHYCDVCDMGFFADLYHNKHINSVKHKNKILLNEMLTNEKK
jgi:hypothetical protein